MKAVASVCASRYDLTQKDNFSALLSDGYVHTADARQQMCYLDQFVVVCGEEGASAATFIVVQVLDNCARDGKTIIGAGTPPDFVENDQAAGRSVMQDVGRLDHLNHKGALPCGQVILCSDACKDTVYQSYGGSLGGNIAADLRHKGNEGNLGQVG